MTYTPSHQTFYFTSKSWYQYDMHPTFMCMCMWHLLATTSNIWTAWIFLAKIKFKVVGGFFLFNHVASVNASWDFCQCNTFLFIIIMFDKTVQLHCRPWYFDCWSYGLYICQSNFDVIWCSFARATSANILWWRWGAFPGIRMCMLLFFMLLLSCSCSKHPIKKSM